MNLILDKNLAKQYNSNSQRIRVLTGIARNSRNSKNGSGIAGIARTVLAITLLAIRIDVERFYRKNYKPIIRKRYC